MEERMFWQLIDLIDRDLLAVDEDAAIRPAILALSKLPPKEIGAFEEHLARHLCSLDGRRYASEAGESGDSADGFLYARCFVVAQGEAHFQRVLDDPKMMPKSADDWCESLLRIASAAHEVATGKPAEFEGTVSYETGSNRSQWK